MALSCEQRKNRKCVQKREKRVANACDVARFAKNSYKNGENSEKIMKCVAVALNYKYVALPKSGQNGEISNRSRLVDGVEAITTWIEQVLRLN